MNRERAMRLAADLRYVGRHAAPMVQNRLNAIAHEVERLFPAPDPAGASGVAFLDSEVRALQRSPEGLQLLVDWHHTKEVEADAIGEREILGGTVEAHQRRRGELERLRDALLQERGDPPGKVAAGYEIRRELAAVRARRAASPAAAMLPILSAHDHTRPPIGMVEARDGHLAVRFAEDVQITREQFFEIFGNCGALVTAHETDGQVLLIRAGEILEFSLGASAQVLTGQRGGEAHE